MSWLILLAAGLCEVAWAVGLKFAQGFTKPLASVLTLCALLASVGLLGLAMKNLPLGTAYAIWVGIGALGTAGISICFLGESVSTMKLLSLSFIALGVIGLKFS